MADNLPNGYADLLNSARQNLVRMPDGTLAPAPNRGGAATMNDIYGGILPQANSGLVSRSVNTVPIGPDGNPSMPQQPTMQSGMMGRGQPSGETWQDKFTAVTGQPLVSVPPPQNLGDFLGGMFGNTSQPTTRTASQPSASVVKDQTRLGYAGLPPDPTANSALGAIDQLTGSGRSTAQPFPLMGFNRPTVPGTGRQPLVGQRDQDWVNQGPDMAALGAINNGGPPMPRPRPTPAGLAGIGAQPSGNYTIRKGDTLSAISQKTGIPVQQLAKLNGIKNPNAIRAGASLMLGGQQSAPAMTAQPARQTAAPARTAQPSKQQALAAALTDRRSRQIAEGKASQLDQFGNII